MNDPVEKQAILVVDDTPTNIQVLMETLKHDYRIVAAVNGERALQLAASDPPPDIILLDVMMPEMDGYEAMQHIRKEQQFKNLPIIALTAKAMKGDRQKCIDAGASDYLSKPIDIEKLLSLMQVWLYK